MNVFYVNIAELNIRITSRYGYIARLCQRYTVAEPEDPEKAIDIDAMATDEDLSREAEILAASDGKEPHPARTEAMTLFRIIAEALPKFDRFLMHGSAISLDGKGYIFTAPSGTGKSTHAALWREVFGSRAVMVNDDKPFIHVAEGGIYVCGSPWNGKHDLGENISVPLKAICLLKRNAVNSIKSITPHSAFPGLLVQTYRPSGPEALESTLRLLDRVSKETELYELNCNIDPQAALVAYGGMNG